MEWNRAKSILIVAFCILNISLFYAITKNYVLDAVPHSLVRDAKAALETYGVKVRTDIPDKIWNLGVLNTKAPPGFEKLKKGVAAVLEKKIINEHLNSDLEIQVPSYTSVFQWNMINNQSMKEANENDVKSLIKDNLNFISLPIDDFIMVKKNESNKQHLFTYVQYNNDIPIFDNYIEVDIKNGETKYEWRYMEIMEQTDVKRMLPAYHVLLKNIRVFAKKEIIAIEMGYKLRIADVQDMSVVLIPAWKVSFSDGTCKYFRANTGDEMLYRTRALIPY